VAFAFRVTPILIVTGLMYALSIGLIEVCYPPFVQPDFPIRKALREL
jgi:hypothetical protein